MPEQGTTMTATCWNKFRSSRALAIIAITTVIIIYIVIFFVWYLKYRTFNQHKHAVLACNATVISSTEQFQHPIDIRYECNEERYQVCDNDTLQDQVFTRCKEAELESKTTEFETGFENYFIPSLHPTALSATSKNIPSSQYERSHNASADHENTHVSQFVVPAKNVQVMNKQPDERNTLSNIFDLNMMRNDAVSSVLLDGATNNVDDMVTCGEGLFVHKTVGNVGGKLSVSGITLEIPAGALENRTLISLGVLWDEKYSPKLSKKLTLLSPIILCHPPGIQFQTSVTLTFPLAAINVKSDWVIEVLKREGTLKEDRDWCPLNLEDYDERLVTDKHISLKLKHFTLYACIGESKSGRMAAKHVYVIAFIEKLQKMSFFKPKIYCVNKYDQLNDIDRVTKRLSLSMADTTTLIIHDNEKDVMVEVAKLSDQWELEGEKIEILPFEQVWHAFHPCCTFIMKPMNTAVSKILCEIHAYQNGAENNSTKLKIAESLPAPFSPLVQRDEHTENLMKELIILLDPLNNGESNAGDWRNLADKIGCDLARIRWLATQKFPTQELIEKWIEEKNTFEELEKLMIEINRPDAAEEIRKYLEKRYTAR